MITKRLRTWQREALQGYRTTRLQGTKELLWEATPGAGKTVAALIVAADQLRQASVDKTTRRTTLFIVVPTAHLKIQWAKSATRLSLRLDPAFRRTTLGLAPDYHGAVVTYQQIANNPKAFRQLMKGSPVILDEVHHAGDGLTWGAALREALTEARFILSLSGTAFRSDSNPIPFVKYDDIGRSVPDYSYTYSRAIEEGVCRPVAFFGNGGEIAWGTNQQVVQVNFAD